MSKLERYDDTIRHVQGVSAIGGVDEAGRGALAGPVVAAVVVLGPGAGLAGVNDSKTLKPAEREAMVPRILAVARGVGLGLASAAEIDAINVLAATHRAAERALEMLGRPPEFLVTDYLRLANPPCPMRSIARADSTSLAVAAASVLAKVARDRLMGLFEAEFPQYGFARHKGYGTERHLAALASHGPSTLHRLSFKGVTWFDLAPVVQSRSAAGDLIPRRPPRADPLILLDPHCPPEAALAHLPTIEFASRGARA